MDFSYQNTTNMSLFASETPPIFRGIFIRENDLDLGPQKTSCVPSLFRPRNKVCLPAQYRQSLGCMLWIWRQNIEVGNILAVSLPSTPTASLDELMETVPGPAFLPVSVARA